MSFLKFYKNYLVGVPVGLVYEFRFLLRIAVLIAVLIVPTIPLWFIDISNPPLWYVFSVVAFVLLVTVPVIQYVIEKAVEDESQNE